MKRTISILLSLLMLLSSTPLSGLIAFAEETETSGTIDENISWEYDADTKTLTFSGEGWVSHTDTIYGNAGIKSKLTEVEHLVFNEGVTLCIASKDMTNLKTVSYPKTATRIPDFEFGVGFYFRELINVESVTVADDNPVYRSIDGVLFELRNKELQTLLYYPPSKKNSTYFVPSGVKDTRPAFYNNNYLKYVEFDDELKKISGGFYNCSALESVSLPDTVEEISDLFNDCPKVEELTIPKSTKWYNGRTVEDCESFKNFYVDSDNPYFKSVNGVLFNNDVSVLRDYPCGRTDSKYILPNTVKTIGGAAFYDTKNISTVVLPEGLTTINGEAFFGSGLTKIDFPETLTTIGDEAFSLTQITEIILPDSVTSIGTAFSRSRNLTSVKLSNNLTEIPQTAFWNTNVTDITIPRSVTKINTHAFYTTRYGNRLNITVLNPNCAFNSQCFGYYRSNILIKGLYQSSAQTFANANNCQFKCLCTDGTENHDYEETVVEPTADEKGYTLYTCKTCGYNYKSNVIKADEIVYTNGGRTLVSYSPELTDDTFVVPDTVNVISDDAFNNEYLKTVVVSSNVKVIGNSAFENCPNLESVEFSDDAQLEQIESSAFAGTNIQTVVVPESVKSVKSKAFANCIKLDSFDVEENVEEIADDAFENSNNVTLICPYQSASYKFASRKKIPTIAYSRIPDQKYTGKPICPEVAIYDVNGNRMYNGMDFYFTYKNNINVGTAYTVVNGIGAYNGRVKNLKFKIVKAAAKPSPVSASTLKVSLARTSYTYDGGAKKPNVIVKTKAGKTVSSSNYTASYSGARKNVGAYTVTIKFKNSYTGTVKRTFRIYPKATYITKLVAGKKSFTAKWSKQPAQVTGYQVQYCVRSNFKGAKTVTVGSAKTASKKIAKVAGNKKYYVRVRTYKTVGKTRYYSSWSKAKAVKTK